MDRKQALIWALTYLSASTLISNWGGGAKAAEIRVMAVNVMRHALVPLGATFERSHPDTLKVTYEFMTTLNTRIEDGEPADVVITLRPNIEHLVAVQKVVPENLTDVARTALGLAVPAGHRKPDIGSIEAFKRSVQASASIAYPAPAVGNVAALYFPAVLDRLGLSEQLKDKIHLTGPGEFPEFMAAGRAEIGIQQDTEIRAMPGVDFVGTLPRGLADDLFMTAGIVSASKNRDAAMRFIAFLASPAATGELKESGLKLVTE